MVAEVECTGVVAASSLTVHIPSTVETFLIHAVIS